MSGWRGHENFGRVSAPQYSPGYDYYRERERMFYRANRLPVEKPKPKRVTIVIDSTVLWCEAGGWRNGHSFSSKDPDKDRIVRSRETDKVDPYGAKITEDEVFYLCGEHGNGLFRGAAEKTPARPAIPATLEDS